MKDIKHQEIMNTTNQLLHAKDNIMISSNSVQNRESGEEEELQQIQKTVIIKYISSNDMNKNINLL